MYVSNNVTAIRVYEIYRIDNYVCCSMRSCP